MNNDEKETIHRILVIDDNPNIHEDFKTILLEEDANTELDSLRAEVFGGSSPVQVHSNKYKLDFASQGKEGHEKIKQALSENRPYELAFIDMRMPPGWDGIETIEHIWQTEPNIQVVICTAYSDHSWEEIIRRLGRSQNLLILKKPFDGTEVAQLATALTEKWTLAKQASLKMDQLEQMVKERTHELEKSNEQLKHAKENLELIYRVVPSAIFTVDTNRCITSWNNKAAELTGYTAEEVIGKECLIFAFEPCCYKCGLYANDVEKPVVGRECPIKRKDGRTLTISKNADLLKDENGNIIGGIESFEDITERKEAELGQDELLKKVDHINKELREFVSIISHDLKAPLRGIKTLANWILSDCADKLGDQANEQMNLLLERVELMYNLIEGTLQYSRAGWAEGKRVQVNLNNFVPEIINMVVPPENITVTIENELPAIDCEEVHIMQVFQNLLSNAIKYMDKPQGWIKVGCVEQDGFWKFSVADNGPGIEEKHFEKIFKIFQALPTSPDFEGTGVGLTVAKKIIELYDGKIWVESKVGEGSTFFFTLPKQKESRLAGTKTGAKK